MLFFGFFLVAIVAFGLGMGVDRFMVTRAAKKAAQQAAAVPQPQQAAQQPPTAGAGQAAPTPPQKPKDPALTFYETLPKGGKAVLGSGLNPKNEPASAKPAAPAAAPVQPQAQPQMPPPQPAAAPNIARPEPAKQAEATPKPPARKDSSAETPKQPGGDKAKEVAKKAGKGKFAVQVASTRDKKEAETIKARLSDRGFAAYIVESNIQDKGTWYRVRVGRQLEQNEAGSIASAIGKGAMAIPE